MPTGQGTIRPGCSRLPSARPDESPEFVTDGLKTFIRPAQSAFYRRSGPRLVHVREIHLQNHFNRDNKHERLNGEFKHRLKAARGLRDENSALIGLMIIHHSFFREHSAPGGRTPAEAAGITMEDPQVGDGHRKRGAVLRITAAAAMHRQGALRTTIII